MSALIIQILKLESVTAPWMLTTETKKAPKRLAQDMIHLETVIRVPPQTTTTCQIGGVS
jgi:hypothetical protein